MPAWISATAAAVGTILTAVVVFGLVGHAPSSPGLTTPATQTAPTPPPARVTIDAVSVGADSIEGRGAFEYVDTTLVEVLFVGRPSVAPVENWLAIRANLAPDASQGQLVSGHWVAARPAPVRTTYTFYAVLWPAAPGANELNDLRANGPNSEFVLAKSEPWQTE